MNTNRWLGSASPIAQVTTFLFGGTWEASDAVRVSFSNGKVYDFVVGSTVIATLLDTIVAAWVALDASLFPEFAEITPTRSSSTLVLTSATPGIPFTVTLTPLETDGSAADSQTIAGAGVATTGTTSTTSTGPNDFGTAKNWSLGYTPQGLCAAPVQANAVASSGGTLVDTSTYYWVVTATNANGETVVSNEKSLLIAAPNQQATISWAQVSGATGYKVYRNTSSGVFTNKLLATITSGSTVSYLDTGTATGAGTPPGGTTAVGDDVVIDLPVPIKYGLDQSAITLLSLTVFGTFAGEGQIGLPETNEDAASYHEYREQYLKISYATADIGVGDGDGCDRIKINPGSVAHTTVVHKTGTSPDADLEAVLLLGTNTGNVVTVKSGASVGVALLGGESAKVSTLTIDAGGKCQTGSGVTLTTIVNKGSLQIQSAVATSLTNAGGDVTILGTGAVAQLTVRGGSADYRSTGTLGGATVVSDNGSLTFDGDPRSKTVSAAIDLHSGGQVIDSKGVVASLVLDFNEMQADVSQCGTNYRWTRAATA